MSISRISVQMLCKPAQRAQQSRVRFGSELDDLRKQVQQDEDNEVRSQCERRVLVYKDTRYTVADFLFDLVEHGGKTLTEMTATLPMNAVQIAALRDALNHLNELHYVVTDTTDQKPTSDNKRFFVTYAGQAFLQRAYPNRVWTLTT